MNLDFDQKIIDEFAVRRKKTAWFFAGFVIFILASIAFMAVFSDFVGEFWWIPFSLTFVVGFLAVISITSTYKCPKCGFSLITGGSVVQFGLKFCPHCGVKLVED